MFKCPKPNMQKQFKNVSRYLHLPNSKPIMLVQLSISRRTEWMCSGGKLTGEMGSSRRGGCSGSSFHWKRRLKEPVAVCPIWPCHRRTAVTTNTINSGWVSTRRQAAPAQCCNAHMHTQAYYISQCAYTEHKTYTTNCFMKPICSDFDNWWT